MTETDNIMARYPDVAFIDKAYKEAMRLVQDTAAYLEEGSALARDSLPEPIRATFTGESLRHSTRLMQVVAWLMVQKAVVEGELSPDEANVPSRRLGGRDICLGPAMPGSEQLPSALSELLVESRHIYERVARLEDRMTGSREGGANPVHRLLDRLSF